MQAIGDLYQSVLHPLAQVLLFLLTGLHQYLGYVGLASWGLTIIVFTVLVKLVFWPLTVQQIRASKAMQSLQPHLSDLKKQHGKDREALAKAQMDLYKEHRVNPMAGCLPMLIQLPIWYGLYAALDILAKQPDFAASFLWIPSLAQPEPLPYILAILTAASQFVVQRMMVVNATDPQQKQMNQMMQFMPLMYLFFSIKMPAGLVLYWVASNVFTMIQQSFYYGWSSVMFWKPAPAVAGVASKARREVAPTADGTVTTVNNVNGKVNGSANGTMSGSPNGVVNPTNQRRTKKRRK
ncbi:MAG TPA: YidC/Oxa1 family membrane protein insertase [Chloroflexota bacterium]|nr:YidC/Oxa1 family membrane protein insertase [Chloroflexota bacterium]